MNRRSFFRNALNTATAVGVASVLPSALASPSPTQAVAQSPVAGDVPGEKSPKTILLKDYRPKSIFKVPVSEITKARFPIIDMHSHPYAETPEQVAEWVRTMDEVGVQKTVILTMATGTDFDNIYRRYAKYPERFEMWCGLQFADYDQPGFPASAVRELQRCHAAGAMGVGEIHDKGMGLASGQQKTAGLHPDDDRVSPIWEKCAELHMPVSLHVADPIWMYQPMDETNDGLMNAFEWRLDNKPDLVKLPGMIEILERTARKHPRTTWVACHFANLDYDLATLGGLFERNRNLYADISARYAETAPIPRFVAQFYAKHADRLVYGTDMGFDKPMYHTTFRILESLDEHFYETGQFGYHWSLNGFGLPDTVLRRVYHENAAKLLAARKAKA
jgi:predicted TIM-barrel fold metal-dependent hydrolase